MEKDAVLHFLNQYDFKYYEYGEIITVKLDFAQRVIFDFSKPEKLIIKDTLTGWNFLTGFIEMSLKSAVLYNFISGMIMFIILIFIQSRYSGFSLIPMYLMLLFWVLLFSGYYMIKLESFKTQIMALYSAKKNSPQ